MALKWYRESLKSWLIYLMHYSSLYGIVSKSTLIEKRKEKKRRVESVNYQPCLPACLYDLRRVTRSSLLQAVQRRQRRYLSELNEYIPTYILHLDSYIDITHTSGNKISSRSVRSGKRIHRFKLKLQRDFKPRLIQEKKKNTFS